MRACKRSDPLPDRLAPSHFGVSAWRALSPTTLLASEKRFFTRWFISLSRSLCCSSLTPPLGDVAGDLRRTDDLRRVVPLMGDTVSEISTRLPSLRRRTVS